LSITEEDLQPAKLMAKNLPFSVTVLMLLPRMFIVMIFVGLILLLVRSIADGWWTKRRFFTVLSWIAYVLCIGGTVFNILDNAPLYYKHPQSSSYMFFYPMYNRQFALEGYFAGSVMILFASSLLGMSEFLKSYPDGFMKKIISTVFLWIFWTSVFTIVVFFTFKQPHWLSGTVLYPYVRKIVNLFQH
jgi:hypothetical protein